MRRLLSASTATLIASFVALTSAASVLTSNFVYNDLLSHPQYQLQFVREPIPQSSINSNILRFGNDHHERPHEKNQPKRESIEGEAPDEQTTENSPLSKASRVIMTSSDGQRWACDIPEPVEETTTDTIKLSSAELEKEEARLIERGLELLHATKDSCIRRTFPGHYWTYEFCYKNKMEQYHLGQDISKNFVKDSPTYTIGLYKPEAEEHADSRSNAAQKSLQKASKRSSSTRTSIKDGHDRKQLVQEWSGGTICDLTNKPRKAKIHYQCEPGLLRDEITSAFEVATCVYTAVISSPRLCQEEAFKPVPQPKPVMIECRPVISDDEHRRYLLYSIDGSAPENNSPDGALAQDQPMPPPALPQPPNGPTVKTLAPGEAQATHMRATLHKEHPQKEAKNAASTKEEKTKDQGGSVSTQEKEQLKLLYELIRKSLGDMPFEEFVENYVKLIEYYDKVFPGGIYSTDMMDTGIRPKASEENEESEVGEENQ
ncbi:Protein OS-9 [Actinomortierella wolfii]|nr:Protein OS-9 [Actinomortierella wolfii]